MAIPMRQHIKHPFRQTKADLLQEAGFEAGRCNRSGNDGCSNASLRGRAHRFIGWQLQDDAQRPSFQAELRERLLKDRPGVDGWHIDAATKGEIDVILKRCIPTAVSPAFMAPPVSRPKELSAA
jgi:hypothetical protein